MHLQRLAALEEDSVLIADWLESDGRPPRAFLLQVNRQGQVLSRVPLEDGEGPGEELPFEPLPFEVSGHVVEARKRSGRFEIILREEGGDHLEAGLAVLPRARFTRLEGLVLSSPADRGWPAIGVLAWSSEERGSRVRGLLVLDLLAGKAVLHQKRGLAAHRRSDFPVAAGHFRAAWRADPEDPLGAYNLACALVQLGQHERALTYLWKAVSLDGPRIRVFAARDPDLDPIRSHPDFAAIAGPAG